MMPPARLWHTVWRLIHPSAWNRNSPKFAKKVVINTAIE
jgi:hypothetical protein